MSDEIKKSKDGEYARIISKLQKEVLSGTEKHWDERCDIENKICFCGFYEYKDFLLKKGFC